MSTTSRNISVRLSHGPIRHLVIVIAMVTTTLVTTTQAGWQREAPTASAAAVQAQKWGIRAYSIAVSGVGTPTTRTTAALLDGQGVAIGEYVRSRQFEPTADGRTVNELHLVRTEIVRLTWQMEVLEIETDTNQGVFTFTLNGRPLGQVTVQFDRRSMEPEVAKLLAERRELVDIAAAVGDDLDEAVAKSPDR